MKWNKHSELEGTHAFLSASQHSWLNYDDNKLIEVYKSAIAKQKGTATHEFAATCIRRRQKLPKTKETLNMHVNDAIGYRMMAEQVLYYSPNCFGTADAISFDGKMLRIHDLKTGVSKVYMDQLLVYAALFCLEYGVNPKNISIELRIYQSNDYMVCEPDADSIIAIMATIKRFDRIINKIDEEEAE